MFSFFSRGPLAFALIAFTSVAIILTLLASGKYAAILFSQREQLTSAAEINMAGRQRMLSQKIALGLLQLKSGVQPVERDQVVIALRSDIRLMQDSYVALTQGNAGLGVAAPKSAELRALYFDPVDGIQKDIELFFDRIDRIERIGLAQISARNPLSVEEILLTSHDLLPKLDVIVSQYEIESEARFDTLRQIAHVFFALFLGAMACAVMFVVRPTMRRLAAYLEEIEFQKSALDEHAIVSETDLGGNIRYVNQKFCDISGYAPDELIGHSHNVVNSSTHEPAFFRNLWETITAGKVWRGEITNRKKDGSLFWTDATIVPFKDDNGQPTKFLTVRSDISHKVLEAERAERANRAKSDFLSSMSHELRTPLNAINGFSQLMLMSAKEPLNERQKSHARNIHDAGQMLLKLINEILDLAKIEAGQSNFSIEPVSFHEIIGEALNMIQPTAQKYGVNVEFTDSTLNDTTLMVDRVKTCQVMINLLSNACKYNRPAGSVWIGGAPSKEGYFRISVVDTGYGIPEEKIPHLFEAFNRLGAENSNIEGTGIGLPFSRALVEQMGGEIGFFCTENQSSTFWIDLPVTANQTPQMASMGSPELALSVAQGRTFKVLYVEDNPVNVSLMQEITEDLGSIELSVEMDGLRGLEAAEKLTPDLIILDINLGNTSGIDLVKRLRKSPSCAHIPVIALTADGMRSTKEVALGAGFDDYLLKPIQIDKMIEKFENYLA